jgi:mannitol/fructose-specific phosphotransferase system IIA component (Ntr-type)
MPGRISTLLAPAHINLNVQSGEHAAALQEVAGPLASHPAVVDFNGFYQELLAREQLDTTYLGHGIALPHARTQHVNNIVVAVGRSTAGVHFTNCNETVHLMIVLGTPKSNPTDYLMVVSSLCKIFNDPANRAALMEAATAEEFFAALVAAESKISLPA